MSNRHRLRGAADISRVRRRGMRVACPYFVLFVAPGDSETTRLAITTPRRLGAAVARNRMRRRLRAAFRPHLATPQPVVDMVAQARRPVADAPWDCLTGAVAKSLAQARAAQVPSLA
ncbi:MAG: ribonuclease P protein component [Chloroflexi bacterium]|nr:ribonuclease P protein component [Chloroflexota bacterium]